MVYIVGAGPGDPDLITVKGEQLLRNADVVIWAGSLVNPEILKKTKRGCCVYDSAFMTLEEVLNVVKTAHAEGKTIVRLHTGDPAIYGAIKEQMDILDELEIPYEIVPGVSSLFGAAAALKAEFTLPGVTQSVIITRLSGKTPVPERERLAELSRHGATMAIFLSVSMIGDVVKDLLQGGAYTEQTPAAVVYKATWSDELILRGNLGNIANLSASQNLKRTAIILVGEFLSAAYERSKLYDPAFSTMFRVSAE
ncbi:MAG: precorrin-4 C(11)-methyltransferase [Spirochaetaceae bacterium]|nr:precorrin-4 C(11)-methyltransferase [Spirochaetaceae bacterium]